MRQDEDRADHDVEGQLLAGKVAADEVLVERQPGVVDQETDGALVIAEPHGDPLDVGPVGQVRDQHLGVDARGRLELRGKPRQALLVARDEDEVVLRGGQLPGELEAEAGLAPVTSAVPMRPAYGLDPGRAGTPVTRPPTLALGVSQAS